MDSLSSSVTSLQRAPNPYSKIELSKPRHQESLKVPPPFITQSLTPLTQPLTRPFSFTLAVSPSIMPPVPLQVNEEHFSSPGVTLKSMEKFAKVSKNVSPLEKFGKACQEFKNTAAVEGARARASSRFKTTSQFDLFLGDDRFLTSPNAKKRSKSNMLTSCVVSRTSPGHIPRPPPLPVLALPPSPPPLEPQMTGVIKKKIVKKRNHPPPDHPQRQQFKSPSHLRRKRPRSDSASSLSSCSTNNSAVSVAPSDFSDPRIESVFLNAGASDEALSTFFNLCRGARTVGFALIFFDEVLSSSFAVQTERFCTAKGAPCVRWNCSCDKHSRGVQGQAALVGAMFILESSDNNPNSDDGCFLLPLGPTEGDISSSEATTGFQNSLDKRTRKWPLLPFVCRTKLKTRFKVFEDVICDPSIKVVTYNAALSYLPIHFKHLLEPDDESPFLPSSIFDIKVASSLLNTETSSADESEHEFEAICRRILRERKNDLKEDDVNEYNTLRYADRLDQLQSTKLKLQRMMAVYDGLLKSIILSKQQYIFFAIEMPLTNVLSKMEATGVPFLPSRLTEMERQLNLRLKDSAAFAKKYAQNNGFNIASPQQVSDLLYLKLGIKAVGGSTAKKTHGSTSSAVLNELKNVHPVVQAILDFREANKLITTYLRPLALHACEDPLQMSTSAQSVQKRIYPTWNQSNAATGRLSCRKPNIQTLPKGTHFNLCIKDAFCSSSSETCLLSMDYAQQEIRILAHFCKDEKLIGVFQNDDRNQGVDIYERMASLLLGKNVRTVSKSERATAKQILIASIYGMSHAQIAKKLNITQENAKGLMSKFFSDFPSVRQYIDSQIHFAKKNGFVATISGRRRYLHDISSDDFQKRSAAERQAVNTSIQGSAADIMKWSMNKLEERLQNITKHARQKEGPSANETKQNTVNQKPRLIMQIHDEVLFEVQARGEAIEALKSILVDIFGVAATKHFNLAVPLILTTKVGMSYGNNMKECE